MTQRYWSERTPSMRPVRLVALGLAMSGVLIACSESTGVQLPASLRLSTNAVTLVVGDSVRVSVTATDASGNVIRHPPLTWSTPYPMTVSVMPSRQTGTAVITAVGSGLATVIVSSGRIELSLSITVLTTRTLAQLPNGQAAAVNARGVVAGSGDVAPGVHHAFRWSADSGFTDLGTLPGDNSSIAAAINDSGVIVGQSVGVTTRAFMWSSTRGMTTIPVMTQAVAVNNHGLVLGDSGQSITETALLWDPQRGVEALVGPAGDASVFAAGLNDLGQAVGGTTTVEFGGQRCRIVVIPFLGPRRICSRSQMPNSNPVLWTTAGGAVSAVDIDPAVSGSATGINDNGVVVGSFVGGGQAFVIPVSNGVAGPLQLLPGGLQALALNNAGDVVGTASAAGAAAPAAWPAAGALVLLSDTAGAALGINDAGQIAGYVQVGDSTYAMLWALPAGGAPMAAGRHTPAASYATPFARATDHRVPSLALVRQGQP